MSAGQRLCKRRPAASGAGQARQDFELFRQEPDTMRRESTAAAKRVMAIFSWQTAMETEAMGCHTMLRRGRYVSASNRSAAR